jgi:hypothetical protein
MPYEIARSRTSCADFGHWQMHNRPLLVASVHWVECGLISILGALLLKCARAAPHCCPAMVTRLFGGADFLTFRGAPRHGKMANDSRDQSPLPRCADDHISEEQKKS